MERQNELRSRAAEHDDVASKRGPREPSVQARHALDCFARLYCFFGRDVLLAGALGWDEATVAMWRGRGVVRPQVKKAAQVELLLELCEETRPYLHGDLQVGEWVSTGLPNLRGSTPAQWLVARGHRGLRELTYGLVDWMPRLPAGEIEPVQKDAAAKAIAAHRRAPETAEFLRMLGGDG
jgi:hypothetical protein